MTRVDKPPKSGVQQAVDEVDRLIRSNYYSLKLRADTGEILPRGEKKALQFFSELWLNPQGSASENIIEAKVVEELDTYLSQLKRNLSNTRNNLKKVAKGSQRWKEIQDERRSIEEQIKHLEILLNSSSR